MRKLARATGAGLLLCLGAASPSEAQWRRIDSPNFVVIGDVGEGTLRDVAVKFEAFREMLGRVLGERVLATPVPTVVLVFPNERALTPFKTTFDGKPVELSGLFVGQRDINYIAVVSDGQPDRFRTVFHEFVHLVVSNMEVPVPAWLNEGLAEYYSTFEIYKDGREAILGNPIDHHLGRLKETPLLPLDQLLSVDHESPLYNEGNKRSLFYAQSWALTHLILLGQPARTDELNAYVKQLSQGVPVTQAWQQAFGAADIARQLEIYVRRQSFKAYQFKFTDKLASFDVAATKLPGADAAAFLTDFLVRQDRLDESAARVAAATKLDPDNARLKIVAAEIDVARRDYDAAHARLRSLGASADWLTAYLAGVAVAELNEKKPGRPEPQDVEAARHFFDIAAGDRPPFANALARMAFLDLSTGSVPSVETRAAIERARSVAPGRKEYTFIHAQVLARQSDFAAARGVISPLLTTAYPEETRAAARRVMSDIADLESVRAAKDLRARAAAAATVALPPPIMTDKPGAPSSPSAASQPICHRPPDTGVTATCKPANSVWREPLTASTAAATAGLSST
jgi:Protein of unknown function (DUF1570)